MSRFGPLPMLNLIIALREKHVPLEAITLTYFTGEERVWLRNGLGHDAASMLELVEAARKMEGK